MSNKKLYITSIVAIVAIILTSTILIGFQHTKSSTETTVLLKNQVVDNLEFKNATMDGNKLSVEVYNSSGYEYQLSTIDVTYFDSNGNKITTVNGYIGNTLDSKDTKQLVVETDEDLSAAATLQYQINK